MAKQCVLGTIGYYTIFDEFDFRNSISPGIERASKMFEVSKDFIYTLANEKFEPLYIKFRKNINKRKSIKQSMTGNTSTTHMKKPDSLSLRNMPVMYANTMIALTFSDT